MGGLWVVGCGLLGDTHTPTTFKPKTIGGSLAVACDAHLVHPLHPVKEGKRPRANGKRQAGATQMRDAASLPNLSQLSACARHVAATGGAAQSAQRAVLENDDIMRVILEHLHNLSPEQAVAAIKASMPEIKFEEFKKKYQRTAKFALRAYETGIKANEKRKQNFVVKLIVEDDTPQREPESKAFSARKIIDVMNAQFPTLDKADEYSNLINRHIYDRITYAYGIFQLKGQGSPLETHIKAKLHETDADEGHEAPLGKNLLHTFRKSISAGNEERQNALACALRDMFVQEWGYGVLTKTDEFSRDVFRLVDDQEGVLLTTRAPNYANMFVWELSFEVVAWEEILKNLQEDMLKILTPAGVSKFIDAIVKALLA